MGCDHPRDSQAGTGLFHRLVLRASFAGGDTQKLSGAAALIAGKRRQENFEDDDSGGGTTPFLRLERKEGGTLTIRVAGTSSRISCRDWVSLSRRARP